MSGPGRRGGLACKRPACGRSARYPRIVAGPVGRGRCRRPRPAAAGQPRRAGRNCITERVSSFGGELGASERVWLAKPRPAWRQTTRMEGTGAKLASGCPHTRARVDLCMPHMYKAPRRPREPWRRPPRQADSPSQRCSSRGSGVGRAGVGVPGQQGPVRRACWPNGCSERVSSFGGEVGASERVWLPEPRPDWREATRMEGTGARRASGCAPHQSAGRRMHAPHVQGAPPPREPARSTSQDCRSTPALTTLAARQPRASGQPLTHRVAAPPACGPTGRAWRGCCRRGSSRSSRRRRGPARSPCSRGRGRSGRAPRARAR